MTLVSAITLGLLSPLFVAYSYFAYRYFRYSPWNSTIQGVTLFSQKITMAALVLYFIFDTALPENWPGGYSLLIVLLALLLVEAWATLGGLLHVQRATDKVSQAMGTGYVEPDEIAHPKSEALTTIIYTGKEGKEEENG